MVFGFGKKKSNVIPDKGIQNERQISLSDIKQILIDIEKPRIEKSISEAKKLREKASSHKKNLLELINKLEKDDLKLDDVDKNLRVIINRGKNSVISTFKKETSSDFSNITKYDDILSFSNELNQMLKRIGDVLGLNTRIMHLFAKKYAEELKDEITEIATLRNLLHRTIAEHKTIKDNCSNIEKLITEHLELSKEIEQKIHRLEEINNEINQANAIIKELDTTINDLKSKKEYNEFLQIQNEIKGLESEKANIKNKIDLQFSKISRPLGKYFYISSFDKHIKKIMEDLIKEPFDVITQENKDAIIEILHAVSKSTLAGNLSVKDIEKSVEYIQETIARLDEFTKLKKDYLDKINNLQKSLNVFNIDLLETKESELQRRREDLPRLENTKNKLAAEQNHNKIRLEEIVKEITSDLSRLANTKIILN